MSFRRSLRLHLLMLSAARANLVDHVQSALSVIGNALSQAPFAVANGLKDNNTLTGFFSATCGSSVADDVFVEVKLASAVQISTIVILDAGQAYLEAHPQATGYYNPQVDRDSVNYNSATADSNLSKYAVYYNIYAGTDADYKNNKLVASDVLADGSFTCMDSVQYIRVQLSSSSGNVCAKEIISTIRVYTQAEIGHLVTSIDLPDFGNWLSDPSHVFGQTTAASQIVYESKLVGTDSSSAVVEYKFAAEHKISSVFIASKYAQEIEVRTYSPSGSTNCRANGNSSGLSTGRDILEFDCFGGSANLVEVMRKGQNYLSFRKVFIFASGGPARFSTAPVSTLNLVKTQSAQLWEYVFPSVIDPDGGAVTVIRSVGSASFVTALGDRFRVADISLASVVVGTYQLTIQASDGQAEASQLHTITLIVTNPAGSGDPCLDNGINPSAVSPMTTTVGTPVTQTISATSACGSLTLALVQSHSWLSISLTNAGWMIKVDSVNNGDAGTYQLTLKTLMDSYPSKAVGDSSFNVDISANAPPLFTTSLETPHTIKKTRLPSSWAYTWPAYTDAENDVITVNVNVGAATFFTYTETQLEIADLSSQSVVPGGYTLSVFLADAFGSSATQTIMVTIEEDACVLNGIAQIFVPSITSRVGSAPVTHVLSTTTECGPAVFSLDKSFGWLSMTQVGTTRVITVNPIVNTDAGTYTIGLRTSLTTYPQVTVPDSTFTVTVLANTPPNFASPLQMELKIVKTQTATSWAYTWPAYTDTENDVITVNVNVGAATFFTYTETQLEIADLSSQSVVPGGYTLSVFLADAFGSSATQTIMVTIEEDACVLNGIAQIFVPSITSRVGSAPVTHVLSTTTECGPAVFSLDKSFGWLSMTQVGTTRVITVNPIVNTDAGTYTIGLRTSLTTYPQVTVPDSTFTVTVLANTPPFFASELQKELKIIKPQTATPWSFTLPSVIDTENDPITFKSDLGGASFVVLSKADSLISIVDTSAPEVVVGVYTLTITVSDTFSSNSYQIIMTVRDPCLDYGITGIRVPDMKAQVRAEAAKFEFPAMTECGWATFSLTNQTFMRLTQNETVVISAAPTDNAIQGTYSIVMKTTLKKYPSVLVPNSVFKVTILPSENHPPRFQTEISRYYVLAKSLKAEPWSTTLPNTYDEDGESVKVTFNAKQAHFIAFEGRQLIIANLTDPAIVPNTYKTEVCLDDGRDKVIYELTFLIKPAAFESLNATESEPEEARETEEPPPTDRSAPVFDWQRAFAEQQKMRAALTQVPPAPPKATLKSISNTGLLTIRFSENMANLKDFPNLIQNAKLQNGKRAFEFRVVPSAYSDPGRLEHKWRVVEYSKRSLQLQIEFENPIYVSMEEEADVAEVVINNSTILFSERGLPLDFEASRAQANSRSLASGDQEPLILRKEIPSQLSNSTADKIFATALDSIVTGSKVAMFSNFVLNMALSASLNQLWTLVNAQQLFVLMPLLKVVLPGNVYVFFSAIFQIAAFDYYDTNDMLHELLDVPETDPYNESFGELGFESRYLLNNLGTMLFFFLAIPPQYLLFKCLNWCRHRWSCAKKMAKKLRRTLFYSWFVTTMFESYSVISICCLIALPQLSFDTWGLTVQSTVCLLFVVTYITVPYTLLYRLSKRGGELKNKSVAAKYGGVFEELSLERGAWVFMQPAFFLIRRLILAVTVVAVPYLIVQIYLVTTQSLISLLIVEYVRPFSSPSQRRMELFNEVLLILLLYTMMCFTPWISDVETKYQTGYLSCLLVAFHFVFNISIMLVASLRTLVTQCKVKVAKKTEIKTRKLRRRLREANMEQRMERLKLQKELAEFLDSSSESDPSSDSGADSNSASDSDQEYSSPDSAESESQHQRTVGLQPKLEVIEEVDEEAGPEKKVTDLYNFFYKGDTLTLTQTTSEDLKVAQQSVYSGSKLVDVYQKDFIGPQSQSHAPVRGLRYSQSQVRSSQYTDSFSGDTASRQAFQKESDRTQEPNGGSQLMEFFYGKQTPSHSSNSAVMIKGNLLNGTGQRQLAPQATLATQSDSRGESRFDGTMHYRSNLAKDFPNIFGT